MNSLNSDGTPVEDAADAAASGTTIKEYSQTAAALAELESRYAGATFDLSTKAGMDEAKKARGELRGYRTGLEKARTAAKADALDYTRRVDAEAKAIRERLEALENPIAELIRAEEARVEAEREAAEQARLAREAEQAEKIEAMRRAPLGLIGAKSDAIEAAVAELEAETLEGFDEAVLAAALTARDDSLRQLRVMLTAAKATEEAAALIAAQRAELEQQKAEAAEREREAQAERDREAAERRAAEQAEQAERDRVEAERRAAEKAEADRLQAARDAELAALRQQEADRQAAEQLREHRASERRRVVTMLRGYPDRHASSGVETLKAAQADLLAYQLDAELFADPDDVQAAEDARAAASLKMGALVDAAVAKAEQAAQAAREAAEAAERATAEAQERLRAQAAAEAEHIATVSLPVAAAEALAVLKELGITDSLEVRALDAALVRHNREG